MNSMDSFHEMGSQEEEDETMEGNGSLGEEEEERRRKLMKLMVVNGMVVAQVVAAIATLSSENTSFLHFDFDPKPSLQTRNLAAGDWNSSIIQMESITITN